MPSAICSPYWCLAGSEVWRKSFWRVPGLSHRRRRRPLHRGSTGLAAAKARGVKLECSQAARARTHWSRHRKGTRYSKLVGLQAHRRTLKRNCSTILPAGPPEPRSRENSAMFSEKRLVSHRKKVSLCRRSRAPQSPTTHHGRSAVCRTLLSEFGRSLRAHFTRSGFEQDGLRRWHPSRAR